MPDKAKRIAVYLESDKIDSWAEVTERYGVGDSAALKVLIANEVRRIRGENTKEQRIERIEQGIEGLDAKLDVLLYLSWTILAAQTGGDPAKISANDVRYLKRIVREVMND